GLSHGWSGGSLVASYVYDLAGQLTSEALDNTAFLWQPAPTLAKTTSYDPASPINALTKVDGVAQVHDGRGNRTGAATRTWRYDSRNMLTGANAPGMAATYGYYPEGGRAWKQVNNVTTLYLELDGVEWGTYDAAGTLKERTIRASGIGGAVVAVHAPAGGLIRLLPNRQGSVIGWLRPDGKLGGAYTYDAYGNSPQAGAAGPQFRYAGMRFDAETGLYHTPNRAYDPQDGRWMQLDPIGIKDGLNRYAYVKNSPAMGVDPTGLVAIAACIPAMPACVGAVVEAGNLAVAGTVAVIGVLSQIAPRTDKINKDSAQGAMAVEGAAETNGVQDNAVFSKPPADAWDPAGAKAPGYPGGMTGYKDPKGGPNWVPNPNGKGNGWESKDGGVWVPTGQGNIAHGGPHWDVQYPDGGYDNVRPPLPEDSETPSSVITTTSKGDTNSNPDKAQQENRRKTR
ncbi:RHS repeat-associated core domain-containing protein, partial [Niveispirillum sp. KHB5.9]|uniref:RHS repeat-associated core domain-containing protein n=1 Tax=Niveispirillum sp. KHB5.9 TaxID=3400269 RepID=UPI003A83E8AD